jgi:hypothetical protein
MKLFFSCKIFFNFRSSNLWIRIGIQPKMLDPDPYQMNTDRKHYFFFQPVIEQCCSVEKNVLYIYLFFRWGHW